MSETPQAPEAPQAPETPQGGESPEEKGILRDLQAERGKRQALQQQLDDRIKADEEAETARLAEQNKFEELYNAEKLKVAEYEPLVNSYKERDEATKAALLEQLGDDAADFEGLGVQALEKVVAKLTNISNPPREPGKPGQTPSGKFGGYDSMEALSQAVASRKPGAREAWDAYKASGGA